jgi:hypothetical protein
MYKCFHGVDLVSVDEIDELDEIDEIGSTGIVDWLMGASRAAVNPLPRIL